MTPPNRGIVHIYSLLYYALTFLRASLDFYHSLITSQMLLVAARTPSLASRLNSGSYKRVKERTSL